MVLQLLCFPGSVLAANWALLIGIENYRDQHLADVPWACEDMRALAATLRQCANVATPRLLLNQQATRQAIEQALRDLMRQTTPQDLVFIAFSGHGRTDDLQRTFWLTYDSDPYALVRSALSFSRLQELLASHGSARQIILCTDHQRDRHYTTMAQQTLSLTRKKFCYLQACYPHEVSGDGPYGGIFNYFVRLGLQGGRYLGISCDRNQDGAISLTELAHFVSWTVPIASGGQHPIVRGAWCVKLTAKPTRRPSIQLVWPPAPYACPLAGHTLPIAGWVRSQHPLVQLTVNGHPATLGILGKEQARQLRILQGPRLYWFKLNLTLAPAQQCLTIVARDSRGQVGQRMVKLWQPRKGWFGEIMPYGLKRGQHHGEYIWIKDQSLMVYVQPGECQIGLTAMEEDAIFEGLSGWQQYLRDYRELLKQNEKLKLLLIDCLGNINQAVRLIGQRVRRLGQRVETFTAVQSWLDHHGDAPVSTQIQPLPETPGPASINRHYLHFSSQLLHQTWQGLEATRAQIAEITQELAYLKTLQHWQGQLHKLWQKHPTMLTGFYIDKYEVTNQAYCLFCQHTGYSLPPAPWWQRHYVRLAPNHPVVNVSWYDAQAYCLWAGKELPSEVQWEKAARGSAGLRYPWGDHFPDPQRVNAELPGSPEHLENLTSNSQTPRAVTSLPMGTSPWGALHMSGNVWEWCRDVFERSYQNNTAKLPGSPRVCRGGSFASPPGMLLSAFRWRLSPSKRRSDLGFRCIVAPE